MCFGGGDGGAKDEAAHQADLERGRQATISLGMKNIDNAFSGFDDNFYNNIAKQYTDYANPQLDTQYQQALKQLTYALARSGISSSSAAGAEQTNLDKQYNQYRTDVASQGQQEEAAARSNNSNTRNTLVNQLINTQDQAGAGAQATSDAALASKPPTFSPVGNFAFQMSQGLQNQSAQNGYNPLLSPYLFGQPSSTAGGSSGGNVTYH